MHLIDTHVHLNFEAFQPDFEAVVQRWREAGVVRLVHSCVEPSEFEAIQSLAQRYPELFFAVGLHPLDVDQWQPELEGHIQSLATSDAKVVAIGETGLDFYKASHSAAQFAAFEAQLRIAQRLDLPVIIHCRDAAQPMVEFLRQFWAQQGPVRGVMHCWGGTPAETQWFLDLGFYISFSGTVTFKNATSIHESAQQVPPGRLLIETDCPFLAPVPKRGERRNEPAYVLHVAQRIAALRACSPEELAQQTTENACQLFKLPRPAAQPLALVD
ncbi:MAG: TatD family hydrolase [Thermosynechococcaceae cyanobacterium]